MLLGVNKKGDATKSLRGARIDVPIELVCGFAGVCCPQRSSMIEFALELGTFVNVKHTCICMRKIQLLPRLRIESQGCSSHGILGRQALSRMHCPSANDSRRFVAWCSSQYAFRVVVRL